MRVNIAKGIVFTSKVLLAGNTGCISKSKTLLVEARTWRERTQSVIFPG